MSSLKGREMTFLFNVVFISFPTITITSGSMLGKNEVIRVGEIKDNLVINNSHQIFIILGQIYKCKYKPIIAKIEINAIIKLYICRNIMFLQI